MPQASRLVPTILVSNDDGIDAEGLVVLERIARTISGDVWVVAPEREQSGAGHSLTLHAPVRVKAYGEKRFSVSGTPTDCVLMALKEIIPASSCGTRSVSAGSHAMDGDPVLHAAHGHRMTAADLLLSGVNRGSNAADDITYSGTVAAAMEGTILGVPSIALSLLTTDSGAPYWNTAEAYAVKLIPLLLKQGWPAGTFINLNFPNCSPDKVKGVRVCPQGRRRVGVSLLGRVDPKGRPYYWIGGERDNTADTPGVDVDLLHQDYVTVTPIRMDMTDYTTLERLAGAL